MILFHRRSNRVSEDLIFKTALFLAAVMLALREVIYMTAGKADILCAAEELPSK